MNWLLLQFIKIRIAHGQSATDFFDTIGGSVETGGGSVELGGGGLFNPLAVSGGIFGLLRRIITRGLIPLASAIVPIIIIYGGFQILTAGGNPEKVTSGKKTILYAVIGYAIILMSWGLVAVIQDILGVRVQ